ncbi:MAG TPA: S41 family peptidase [Blastocatellia bacterium]|nr:S41 family peptidase [Blastocatellia bacterium]
MKSQLVNSLKSAIRNPQSAILHALFTPVLLFCSLVCLRAPEALPHTGVRAQSAGAADTREDRLRVFEQVWRAIYDNYYDKRYRGVDWRLQREIFRPQAEAARNSAEFYRVLRQMIGKLGDAHTRVYTPEEGFDRDRPAGATVGVAVRRIEGKPVVTWVDPGSEAERRGIRPGFTVSQVDGLPVEKALERIRDEIIESSTQTALETQTYDRLFHGARDTPVLVTFLDNEERRRPVTLIRRFVEFQRRVVTRKSLNNIGYIEITGFGPEIEKDFEAAMQEAQGTRGLILDLRNNGGGFVATVAQIASYFLPEGDGLGEFISRQGRAAARYTQRSEINYREPLVVLVSARSASGSEIFAAAMQERKRAIIIGVSPTTCGCLLGVSRTLKLLDGGKLNVSDSDYRTALGRRIEGLGVKPDLHLETRIADLLAGRDRIFELAVDQLGRMIAFGPRGADIEFRLNLPNVRLQSSIHGSDASQSRP